MVQLHPVFKFGTNSYELIEDETGMLCYVRTLDKKVCCNVCEDKLFCEKRTKLKPDFNTNGLLLQSQRDII